MTSEKAAQRGPGTAAVHGGALARYADDAAVTPVQLTSTYVFDDSRSLIAHHEGEGGRERYEYGRYGNPTVRDAELRLAALEGADDARLFASGMAAVTTAILALVRAGDRVVLTNDCYRRTRQFVTSVLPRYGVTNALVAPGDWAALDEALADGKAKVLFAESPTNPFLRVADLGRLAAVASRYPALKLIVDATFATPVNQRPLAAGVDLVVHSATKYLGGHNDLMAGVVAGGRDLVRAIGDLRGVLGGIADPHAAYLLVRGLKTLHLRVARQNATALAVARFLAAHPRVERVFYPGLEGHPDHALARAQMSGFGGVVSFCLRGTLEGTSHFIDACRLARIAPSLGGVETLIEQPALMSFYELGPEGRASLGIPETLVRLSVGVEDEADIVADLAQALGAAEG